MASLTAKANVGAGTDQLSGYALADGFAGSVVPVNSSGAEIGFASETTLAAAAASLTAIDADLTTLITRSPVNAGGAPFVTTSREKFRDAFLTYDTTNNWTTVQTGSGMAITVAGAASGARYLNIASGTTINAETIITSKTLFRAPCSVIVGFSMSQRIANCDAFIEMVECDALGVAIPDTTQASARFRDARNGASFQFNGTVATTQTVNVRQDGLSEVTATGTFTTTAATGSGPNFIPAGLFEMTLRTRDIQFSSVAVDANAAKTAPLFRTLRVPNPDALYMLRIRVLNGGTAPASTSDIRIHSVVVLDDTRITVDFGSIAGTANLLNAAPIQIVNTPTVALSANTPVLAAGANLAADVGVQIRATTNGASFTNVLSAATNNLTQLKATQGKIAGGFLTNTTASLQYLKLFTVPSASVTMGTTAATTQIALQPNQTVNLSQGPLGVFLGGTGLTIAITTGTALADNTATTAGSVVGFIAWV
jgi:hypothetical protein